MRDRKRAELGPRAAAVQLEISAPIELIQFDSKHVIEFYEFVECNACEFVCVLVDLFTISPSRSQL